MKDVPVYKFPASHAQEHDELTVYRASNKANMACIQKRIFPLEQIVGYGDYRYTLTCVAEHLGAGHHDDVIVRIFGDCRLERRHERTSQRLAEIHTHIGKILNHNDIVFCSKLSDRPELVLGKVEPGRVVRA